MAERRKIRLIGRILVGREVWRAIQRLNRERRGPATILTAFLGRSGTEILPLRSGDRIFVAATEGNVRAGLVNPHELLLYPSGVDVFKVTDLHAKMYCFGKRAILCSANLSTSARDRLLEIGLEITLTVAELDAVIDQIETQLLTRADLGKLAGLYRPPRGALKQLVDRRRRQSVKKVRKGPSMAARIWYHGGYSENSVNQNPLVIGLPTVRQRLRKGDWYIMVYRDASGNRLASAPRQVSQVRAKGNKVQVWFRPQRATPPVSAEEIKRLVEPGKPPIKYPWLLISNRIPSAAIFRRFGLSVSK